MLDYAFCALKISNAKSLMFMQCDGSGDKPNLCVDGDDVRELNY